MTPLLVCILIWPAYVAEISKIYECYINVRNLTEKSEISYKCFCTIMNFTVLLACVIFKYKVIQLGLLIGV
jgi:hypothetical protein